MTKQLLALVLACSCYGATVLQWNESSSDEQVVQYRVYRVKDTCVELISVVLAPKVELVVDAYLSCDSPNTVFYVTAVNSAGESFPSYYVNYIKP